MSKRALDRRTCEHHGPASLYRNSMCVSCEREFGVAADTRVKPPIEQIPGWMRKAILGVDGAAVKPMSRARSGLCGHVTDMSELEQAVYQSLGSGHRLIDIATQLGISVASVGNAITRLQDKYRVGSRDQLRAMARRTARDSLASVL